jgi:hypothetical protein
VFMFIWDMQTVGAWLWDVGALQLRLCECAAGFGILYLDWMVYVSSGLCGLEEKDGLWNVGDFGVGGSFGTGSAT